MTLPTFFAGKSGQQIINYSYADLAGGAIVTVYKGFVSNNNGTKEYNLGTSSIASEDIVVSGAGTAGSEMQVHAHDFDLLFNSSQRIEGTAKLTLSMGATKSHVDGTNTLYISGATLSHVRGSITEILDTVSGAQLSEGQAVLYAKTLNMPFNITNGKNFKAGDILRLNIPLWSLSTGGAGNESAGYGADPKARADPDNKTVSGALTTTMELHVPYRPKF
jgi:hypothetical protein|tara:strand:+ start:2176 stop:2835 length:660 start_codon:yes stop_codon:yes gene_type:complete